MTASADLGVTVGDGLAAVTAGDGVGHAYTITVTNSGPSDAPAVSLIDTWPGGFSQGFATGDFITAYQFWDSRPDFIERGLEDLGLPGAPTCRPRHRCQCGATLQRIIYQRNDRGSRVGPCL